MDKRLGILLSQHKLKFTAARVAVLKFLNETKKPVDVDEIRNNLKSVHIKADEATVYRMLNAFIESTIVRRLEFQEGKYRYELAHLPHHHHLICNNCRTIQDIEECDMDEFMKKLEKKTKFKINSHSLEFFGLCPACQ